ncbi:MULTISPECIES: alpha/beta hydrolase [unclassified Corynebacterium]|uniref:alpha/beta hydrolase n=1 Tax=unclassified Corynebacterium TaxID=2624378 RepID=UPI0029C9FF5B|nr:MULTISPECIES: alpha/beta hydrolase [unclassified Corynebacterium]WPF67039.1 alpha/beta hydrolase [Corynebacterium sp. 22KM0430]WPF69527.1 alpha/beta hydrolase [Corynebacterium sp. 21KM1197]
MNPLSWAASKVSIAPNAKNHPKVQRSLRSILVEKVLWISTSKKTFQQDSEDSFNKLLDSMRTENGKPLPNPQKYVGMAVTETHQSGMQVFTWNDRKDDRQRVILYIHGGAYLHQPSPFHYKMLARIARSLDAKVIFPIYPKLPDNGYAQDFPLMDSLYRAVIEGVSSPEQITLMGDSAGGGFALGFAMHLRDKDLPQPKNIILLSPWLDVATTNPEIPRYEGVDPMLSAWGLNKLGRLWAGSKEAMTLPYVSPLHGDLNGLGKISIFVGTHEIFYPDNQLFHEKLEAAGIEHNYTVAPAMNHVYVAMPIPEAKEAQDHIVEIIRR